MQAADRFRAMKAFGAVVAPTDTVLAQLWHSSPDRATTRADPHADWNTSPACSRMAWKRIFFLSLPPSVTKHLPSAILLINVSYQ